LGLGLGLVGGCSPPLRSTEASQASTPASETISAPAAVPSTALASVGSVQFRIARVRSADSELRYLATSDEPLQSCKFEIRVISAEPAGGALFSMANVSMRRQPTSDCSELLRRIAKEHGYGGEWPRAARTDELYGSLAILGRKQSREDDPGVGPSFSATPPGDWLAGKLFLSDGEGEVYLNLNEQDGIGEFSVKDEDHAVIVVTELAKVLLPQRR
jgi:hypothetical protein